MKDRVKYPEHLFITEYLFNHSTSFQEVGIVICIVENSHGKAMSTQHIAEFSGDGYIAVQNALESLERMGYVEYDENYIDQINAYGDINPSIKDKGAWRITEQLCRASDMPYIRSEEE